MPCGIPTCVWVVTRGQGQCEDGTSTTCYGAKLLEGEISGLHDQTLAAATAKINEILTGIPADSGGRKLSLLHTNMGPFLAWMQHDGQPGQSGVRATDDDATVAEALQLKVVPAGA